MRCVLALLVLLFLGGNVFALGRHETVDIEILVVDSETGEPLSNISTIFMLQKATGLFVDGTFSIIEYERYTTDENGIVRIPKRRIRSLKFSDTLFSAYMFINIDLVNSRRSFESIKYDLSNNFLSDFAKEYLFPNPKYYSANVAIFFRDRERIIYTQINDDNNVKNRIRERTYSAQRRNDQQIIVELVRRSTN